MESRKKLGRLNQKADFYRLSRFGKKIRAVDWLLVLVSPNGLNHSRLGFSIGRQLAPAVVRNKLKRWTRACLVSGKELVPKPDIGFDIHFVFRAPRNEKPQIFFKKLSFAEFNLAVENAVEKIR